MKSPMRAGNSSGAAHVGDTCADGAARHAVELGGFRTLNERGAGPLLHRAQSERSVGAHSRQDHPDGIPLLILGKRSEEKIDRQVGKSLVALWDQGARRDSLGR